jgi:hypothetical protein
MRSQRRRRSNPGRPGCPIRPDVAAAAVVTPLDLIQNLEIGSSSVGMRSQKRK